MITKNCEHYAYNRLEPTVAAIHHLLSLSLGIELLVERKLSLNSAPSEILPNQCGNNW